MPADLTTIRRLNVLTLFQQWAEERIAAGEHPKGLETGFAEHLGLSSSTWSMAKSGSRPIGNRLAHQIEANCGKPAGWLDQEREQEGLTQAEQQAVALFLKTWRATNADGRKKLRQVLKDWTEPR